MRTGNILIGNLKGKDSLSSCRKTIMKILSINIWPFQKQTGQNCSFSTGSILVYKKLNNMGKIQTFSCFWLKKKKMGLGLHFCTKEKVGECRPYKYAVSEGEK